MEVLLSVEVKWDGIWNEIGDQTYHWKAEGSHHLASLLLSQCLKLGRIVAADAERQHKCKVLKKTCTGDDESCNLVVSLSGKLVNAAS